MNNGSLHITLFNMRSDYRKKIGEIIHKQNFNRNVTLLLPECYTEFWQYK